MPMEVQMVPKPGEDMRAFMARCALAYDTAMARAMLRALGIPVPERHAPGAIALAADTDEGSRYRDMAWCFQNREHVDLGDRS